MKLKHHTKDIKEYSEGWLSFEMQSVLYCSIPSNMHGGLDGCEFPVPDTFHN